MLDSLSPILLIIVLFLFDLDRVYIFFSHRHQLYFIRLFVISTALKILLLLDWFWNDIKKIDGRSIKRGIEKYNTEGKIFFWKKKPHTFCRNYDKNKWSLAGSNRRSWLYNASSYYLHHDLYNWAKGTMLFWIFLFFFILC